MSEPRLWAATVRRGPEHRRERVVLRGPYPGESAGDLYMGASVGGAWHEAFVGELLPVVAVLEQPSAEEVEEAALAAWVAYTGDDPSEFTSLGRVAHRWWTDVARAVIAVTRRPHEVRPGDMLGLTHGHHIAICQDCTPPMLMPFAKSAAARSAWTLSHTNGTGHRVTWQDPT